MDLIRKYLGEETNKGKFDDILKKDGWKETHGIALYTNKKYPLMGIDINSGEAKVEVWNKKSEIFNTEGSFTFAETPDKLKKVIEKFKSLLMIQDVVNQFKWKGNVGHTSYIVYKMSGQNSITVYLDQYPKITISYRVFPLSIDQNITTNASGVIKTIKNIKWE
jgi:hypothetical protein